MISVGCFCGSGFPRLALLFGRILEKFSVCIYIYTYVFLYAVNAALDFVIPISSTSLPGGNLVDGLPPAASIPRCFGKKCASKKYSQMFWKECAFILESIFMNNLF